MDQFTHALTMLVTTPVVPAALAGLIWGILGGAMPGLSASITMALLLPFTYTLAPMPAIVMLATCYIGAEYGGAVSAVLNHTTGHKAPAATPLGGYEENRQGRGGGADSKIFVFGRGGGVVCLTRCRIFDETHLR